MTNRAFILSLLAIAAAVFVLGIAPLFHQDDTNKIVHELDERGQSRTQTFTEIQDAQLRIEGKLDRLLEQLAKERAR